VSPSHGGDRVEELQVPTRTIDVEIFALGDRHLTGCLFLVEAECQHGNQRAVLNLLNDERQFVPFGLTVDGERENVVILNKQRILRVHLNSDVERADDLAIEVDPHGETHASFVLIDGSAVAGQLKIEAPWTSSRLVDKLNQAERFIPIANGHGYQFIQATHVAEVD